jgi:hypothetical protein
MVCLVLYLKQTLGDETAIKFLGNDSSAICSFLLSIKMSLKYVRKPTFSKSRLLERFSMFLRIRKALFRKKDKTHRSKAKCRHLKNLL